MDDVSIRLEGVSLCYRLAKQRIPSLKEYAIHFLRGSLSYEKLWALRGVDLTLRRGETLGIIGRNGAGKSTLLKVISRVLKPTTGSARVHGRIAPILELGSGFDYELTGLENVYLNALLLGHTRREIQATIDEIVDFSGLGDFIRSPLRNYSSGMQARLLCRRAALRKADHRNTLRVHGDADAPPHRHQRIRRGGCGHRNPDRQQNRSKDPPSLFHPSPLH